jgi:ATP synthase protein I
MSTDDKTGDKTGRRSADDLSAAERAALSKRASDIGAKIETAKNRHGAPLHRDSSQGNAMAKGLKISAELIGGVVVGGGIGWLLDRWLGTVPWLFILFFLLGSAAGILNIVRQAQREKTPPAPSVRDDDEDDK